MSEYFNSGDTTLVIEEFCTTLVQWNLVHMASHGLASSDLNVEMLVFQGDNLILFPLWNTCWDWPMAAVMVLVQVNVR